MPKRTKLYIGKGAVYKVLLEYMDPGRLVNGTLTNAKTVKTIIKELLYSRYQDWLQTKLYTSDSYITNKNLKLFIYLQNSFFLYLLSRYEPSTYVYNRKLYKR